MPKELFYLVSLVADKVRHDLSQDLTSFTIDESGNQPSMLTIQMSDPHHVFSSSFQEGMEVMVDLGDVEDHAIIFRGHIYKVDQDFPKSGVPTLTLRAYDRSMKMGLRKRNRIWQDVTLKEIVEQIAKKGGYGFNTVKVDEQANPEFKGNGIRQQDETDLAFLRRLAGLFDYEMFVTVTEQEDILNFLYQYNIMKADPAVTLYYDRCGVEYRLLSFQPSVDVSKIQLPRIYAGIDYYSGTPIEKQTKEFDHEIKNEDAYFDENMDEFRKAHADKADQLKEVIDAAAEVQKNLCKELGNVRREPVEGFSTPEILKARAEKQFNSSLQGMRASGTSTGNRKLLAHTCLEILNVGKRFSGKWYLAQVSHVLDKQGYTCTFQCQR
jgi:uncharacterized protein